MTKLPVEEMMNGRQSKYALCIGVAKRARQIAKRYEDSETILDEKPVLMAIEELKENKYSIYENSEK